MNTSPSQFFEQEIENAANYFTAATKEAGLERCISEAVEKGLLRKPVTRHIFVHPEFAWDRRAAVWQPRDPMALQRINEQTNQYALRISGILRKNPNSVVLTYPEAKRTYDSFPYNHHDAVQSADIDHDGSIQGKIDAEGMRKVIEKLESIRSDDGVIIHGAAWGLCPRAFAKQIIGLMLFGKFFPPYSTKTTDQNAPERKYPSVLIEMLHHTYYIARHTRIRFGIQHNTQQILCANDGITNDLCEQGITEVYPF